ncbi:hypothetical protein CERSUDRAFT_74428 [Gelatoporia subvermispora B]|uniref:Uncharacterized protein n=1 Tax=Ceriporiopsis subvermispora (strain B) TaxID=914234 RepID=M2QWG7_CERS8|nr:hypothetical protein CERSUDRAFT_74428 [Gelatoporia subvermispora B]
MQADGCDPSHDTSMAGTSDRMSADSVWSLGVNPSRSRPPSLLNCADGTAHAGVLVLRTPSIEEAKETFASAINFVAGVCNFLIAIYLLPKAEALQVERLTYCSL